MDVGGLDISWRNASFQEDPSNFVAEQIQSLIQSKAISVCDETQLIRINPLSVAEGGGTVRAAQPSTPSVIPHRNSGPGIIAGPKWTAWSETIATARHEGKEELAQILGKSATNSLSQGTMSAYSAMRIRFETFTSSLSIPRAHLGKLRNLFIAHLVHKDQLKAIPMAIAALNFFYGRLEGGEAELQKLLVDSAKRETSPVVNRRKASEEDVNTVVNWALLDGSRESVEDACAILLSFLAFLRISETANVQKKHVQDKGQGVWWLFIPKSKTDQLKRGTTTAFKVAGAHKSLWDQFMNQSLHKTGDHYLFGSTSGPATDALRKRINSTLHSAGLHHKGLTPHSFRGGAATAALRRGVNQEDIKRVGRWKSTSSMLHYLEPTPI
ncbi:hypothetical protein V3C99_012776 [Haemonchus contortus]